MVPVALSISFFKSFRTKQVFCFPKMGLYLLAGKNEQNPELTSNAVGKSSLLDAFCWCLFGKTARGLSAGNIGCWNAKSQTRVSYAFRKGSVSYRLTRTWGPNSLTLSQDGGKPVAIAQETIDTLFGFGYEQFLATILIGQFGTTFFDLGPTEKLRVFSEILNLGYWQERAKRAGELEDSAASDVAAVSLALNTSETEIKLLRERLIEEKEKAEEFDRAKLRKEKTAEALYDKATVIAIDADERYQEAKEARKAGELPKEEDLSQKLREASTAAIRANYCGFPNAGNPEENR